MAPPFVEQDGRANSIAFRQVRRIGTFSRKGSLRDAVLPLGSGEGLPVSGQALWVNQITSYGATGYEERRGQVEDRPGCSAPAKAFLKQRQKLRARPGRLLLVQTKADHAAAQRQKRIAELESAHASDPGKGELARLGQGQKRWQSARPKRQEAIASLSQELARLDEAAQTVQKAESRWEHLIAEKMVRTPPPADTNCTE